MKDIKNGLTEQEVAERIQKGLVNGDINVPTKSIKQIIRTNLVTFFNILNASLAVCILLVGSYKNLLFMGTIIFNTLIGIFQEIRSKLIIDRLTLISAPKAHVIRDGKQCEIPVSQLVMDDITLLSAGRQVCADSVIVDGECEVNESLITGESDPVTKKTGDTLLSGSFIICGDVKAEVIHVGNDNFASKITSGAKYLKKNNSRMMNSLNAIIKVISIFILPLAALLFLNAIFGAEQTFDRAVTSTAAAIIGMIPEGLVLLTSVVLAVSVVRLSMRKTLVQDMYCIETLARVDVLCLDKTGTITEGAMQAERVVPIEKNIAISSYDEPLNALAANLTDTNPTSDAIKKKWSAGSNWICKKTVPFSSAKKYSGAEFVGKGTYIIGAAGFIIDMQPKVAELEKQLSQNGERIILLAHSDLPFNDKDLPANITPLCFIVISDIIRAEAPATLKFFAEQGVNIKIISGDNPVTVANIAKRAGLADADNYVDASTLENITESADKYSVFGRVTPEQKLALVKAFKSAGHTVGMTGDGVNDVLALKESDCSIAMQSGSDAARNVSSLVLLDSNFASMPHVVAEGRRSINNIERSAALFLTKTLYSFVLAFIFLFVDVPYPFQPIQLTLISTMAIGIPSFLLALEPNTNLVKGRFIENVMKKSAPGAVAIIASTIACVIFATVFEMSTEQMSTLCTITVGIVSMEILCKICYPFNWMRISMFIGLCILFTIAATFFRSLFILTDVTPLMMLISGLIGVGACLFVFLTQKFTDPLIEKARIFFNKKYADFKAKLEKK